MAEDPAAKITITAVLARQIYDSRGNPTVEVDVTTQQGFFRAAVPSGASTGIYEALELRDGGDSFHGKGVSQAVKNVNDIIGPAVIGMDPREQRAIDEKMVQELDGSQNEWGWSKSKLGANAILGVSLAVSRAGAAANGIPLYQHIAKLAGNSEIVLPVPAFNVINGGSHAGNALPMQEFMMLPVGASSFKEAMQIGSEVYHHLKKVIKAKYGADAVNVGDEGGFAPPILESGVAWEVLKEAVDKSGHAEKVQFGMDVAASEFFIKESGKYNLKKWVAGDDGSELVDSDALIALYEDWVGKYPLVSIEDGFDEDDWAGWSKFQAKQGENIQIVGDDLLVTNIKRIEKAIAEKSCNALLLKVNQIGSLTESIDAVKKSEK